MSLEVRKQREKEFHNILRTKDRGQDHDHSADSNVLFYFTNRKSRDFISRVLGEKSKGKRILDYCCGDGGMSIELARKGAQVVGIDISEVSIQNAKNTAIKERIEDKVQFFVMDPRTPLSQTILSISFCALVFFII